MQNKYRCENCENIVIENEEKSYEDIYPLMEDKDPNDDMIPIMQNSNMYRCLEDSKEDILSRKKHSDYFHCLESYYMYLAYCYKAQAQYCHYMKHMHKYKCKDKDK